MRNRCFSFALVLLAAACGRQEQRPADTAATATPAAGGDTSAPGGAASRERLSVEMRDANGRSHGTLSVSEGMGGIMLVGRLTGLPPGEHAIHLHMTGKCEPPFTSAGGHWNPTQRQHGTENPKGPHLGDLPNITVGPDSSVTVHVHTNGGTLRGATNALLDADGAAIIVHEKADDYRTDPAGNAGDRIACGVIPPQS